MQKDFAASLDISASNLSSIEAGKINPTSILLDKLVTNYRVSLDYLFTGKGGMFLQDDKAPRTDKVSVTSIDSLDDLILVAQRSTMFRNTVLGYAATYFHTNEAYIRKNMETADRKQEGSGE
jgi:transcriptional regulator with XRE-family HTH domain